MRSKPPSQPREPLNLSLLLLGAVALGWFLASSLNYKDRAESESNKKLANTLSQLCLKENKR